MFSTLHQYPSLSNDLYSRPSLNPRDRYLAALAEAKAAEADYLAAEAIQREEDALRLRLQEIELQKKHSQLLQSPHSYSPYGYPQSHSHDHLAVLRRQLEEEELRRAAAVKQRNEFEEARILALKRKEEEEKLELLTRLRQEEEKRLLALRQEQQLEKERQRARARAEVAPGKPVVQFVVNAAEPKKQHPGFVNHHQHPFLNRPSTPTFPANNHVHRSTHSSVGLKGFEEILKLLSDPGTAQSAFRRSDKPNHAPKKGSEGPQKPVVHFEVDHPKPSCRSVNCQKKQGTSGAAQPSPHTTESDLSALKEKLTTRLDKDEASEVRETIQSILDSLATQHSPSTSDSFSAIHPTGNKGQTPKPSLKEELERRLYSNEAVEIRDTIQAIFASLTDAAPYGSSPSSKSSSSSSSSTSSASSSKGKEKSTAAEPTTLATEPASSDVLKSMQTVQNIEAAFHSVQSDFVFPSQLDFTPTPSRESSPAPPSNNATESSSPMSTIFKLAYTSRNQPVRYYEQTLSALLTQLDGVESFGNEEVRGKRKDVVGRVEKAIEELEEEIEGRWKTKVRNEEKEERGRKEAVLPNATAPIDVQVAESTRTEADTSLPEPEQTTQDFKPDLVDIFGTVESDVSDQRQGEVQIATIPQQGSNTLLRPDDNADVVSISSESSVSTEDEHNTEALVEEPQTDSAFSTTLPSYSPISEPTSSVSSLSIAPSTTSSVATIRPYDVEPESTLPPITSPAESNTTSSTSAHDIADDREEVKGQKVDVHSDSDWSDVDA